MLLQDMATGYSPDTVHGRLYDVSLILFLAAWYISSLSLPRVNERSMSLIGFEFEVLLLRIVGLVPVFARDEYSIVAGNRLWRRFASM